MTIVLQVDSLSKSFTRRKAVDSLSFVVSKGEVTAILGPNGSGKTTTIKCIAGLLRPDSGRIYIGGIDSANESRPAKKLISYLPQTAEFPAGISALETAFFHAALRGADRDTAMNSLKIAGFADSDMSKAAGQLSGGMRHRLSLAIASLSGASLMLLDEPSANLDPSAAQRFRKTAKEWRSQGKAILMSTHVLSDVTEIADGVIVMVDGKAAAIESISEMRSRLNKFSRLRIDVGAVTEKHRDAALGAGAAEIRMNGKAIIVIAPEDKRMAILNKLEQVGMVCGFETEKPSIEDLYVEYVEASSKAG